MAQTNKFGVFCLVILVGCCRGDEDDFNCEFKKDGFYSDEDFCHIYWRCNYGVSEEYECPAGTAWNHKEERCDWLDNVDCTRMDDKEAKEEDVDEEDGGDSKKKKNSKKKTADKAKKAKSKVKAEKDEEYDEDEDDEDLAKLKVILMSRSLDTDPIASNNATNDDNNDEAYIYDTLCANETVATGFREDPYVCNRYIRCNHGYAQKFICSKYTVWDQEKKMCLWTASVECGPRALYTDEQLLGDNDSDASLKNRTTLTTRTTTTSTTMTTIVKTTITVKQLNTDSSRPNTDSKDSKDPKEVDKQESSSPPVAAATTTTVTGVSCSSFGSYYVPDMSNCADYYMCNNGKESKMSCVDKQLFNADTNQCEEFQQVFCGSRAINQAERNLCASKRDGIYPDLERACKVFYQCLNQQKSREASCPPTLKFNSVSSRCDNPVKIVAPCGTFASNSGLPCQTAGFLLVLALVFLV